MPHSNFYNKLINTFGNIYPADFTFGMTNIQLIVPRVIMLIIKNHYSIKSINKFKLDPFLFKPKEYKLSILCTFLVDEGCIYDMVNLRMKDRKLIKAMREITLSLGYKCSKVNKFLNYDKKYIFGFNISNFSLKKMEKDICELRKKYPTCYLAHKQEYFEILANQRRKSGNIRKCGETKKLIINNLKGNSRTIMELARLTGIGRRTARNHIEDLRNLNLVEVECIKGKGAKIWKIKGKNERCN